MRQQHEQVHQAHRHCRGRVIVLQRLEDAVEQGRLQDQVQMRRLALDEVAQQVETPVTVLFSDEVVVQYRQEALQRVLGQGCMVTDE